MTRDTIACLARGRDRRAVRGHRGFVEDVEALRAKIAPLTTAGEAGRAVALLETFIAGCYEKPDEIDDSSGRFAQFVAELFCDWTRARQAAKAEPAGTATTLLSWMESDDDGYCHRLEEELVKLFDRAGIDAFERAVREREQAGGPRVDYAHRRNVEILKAICEARRDVGAYAALCETEGGPAPADRQTFAEMCLKRRRPQDALAWVDRGLELEKKDRWGAGRWGAAVTGSAGRSRWVGLWPRLTTAPLRS